MLFSLIFLQSQKLIVTLYCYTHSKTEGYEEINPLHSAHNALACGCQRKVYEQQTAQAKAENKSNCPYCAIGHDQNAHRIWKLEEMDADHVTAWSKGGSTDIANCQMLCKTHNRAKGNR